MFAPLLFGLLSLGFTSALFGLAVMLRTRYWIPVPVSIKLNSKPYSPTSARIIIPGLSSAEYAILRKDMRSLTRRREMARFLAIPFVLAVSMGISLFQLGNASGGIDMSTTVPLYVIPIAVFSEMLAMTSIGQEGHAVWNIYAAPLSPKQFLKAKILLAILLGVAFSIAMLLGITALMKPTAFDISLLFGLGLIVVLEESALGLCIAAKFPDFRETVRSRYVTIWASFFGMLLGILVAMVTATPIFMAEAFGGSTNSLTLTLVSFLVGGIIFLGAWRLTQREAILLFENIRI
jgi:hypothetical protein